VSDTIPQRSMQPGQYGLAGPAQLSLQRVASGRVWNLQGAADNPAFVAQVMKLWGVGALPTSQRVITSAAHRLLWIGPRSWLMLGLNPHMHADTAVEPSFSDCRDLLNAAGGALFDVSASRVGWTVRGPRAIDLLASGCPLDLHHSAFAPDSCAQSHFGHVAALYHRQADGDFTVYVARSFAEDVWAAICSSAAQYGYEVLPDAQ